MKKNLLIIATVIALLFFPKVNFGQAPVITVEPNNQSVCVNGSVSFTVTAIGTGLTYQWRKGTVNLTNGGAISGADAPTLIINPASFTDAAINYNVIVSAGVLSPNDTSINVSLVINALPNVSISGDPTSFCSGDSVTLDAGVWTSYIWSTGDTSETINATTSGFYVVTVSNSDGCTRTTHKEVTVTVFPYPNIFLSNLSDFCAGGLATLTVGATFSNYAWSTGESTQSISCPQGIYNRSEER